MFIYLISPSPYCEGFISRNFALEEDGIKRIVQEHVSGSCAARAHDIEVDMDDQTVKWVDDDGESHTYHLWRFVSISWE